MSTPAYLTPDEVAQLLRVDRKSVYAAIRDGRLPALRLGRVLRVSADDLQALTVEAGGAPATLPRAPRARRAPRGEFARLAREEKGL